MPHQFKARPEHPIVAYLVRLHADIGGRIQQNKAEAERLADDMRHVEAVLKMFDPQFNLRAISARRRVQGNPWFKRGTLFRRALEVLRTAMAPMTTREIAATILATNQITDATHKQARDLEAGLRSSLENNVGKTVEQVGDGIPKRWKIRQL